MCFLLTTMYPENKKKMFVLGIDGACFDLIDPLIEQGELPNFKKLIENGSRKIMKSSIPPLTAPAWASLQTGCNPGKHGIFDFTLLNKWDSYFVDSTELLEKPFWLFLSENNIKSIIVNVPLTYPIYAINGILISGMETPSEKHNYIYPPELKEQFQDIGYVIEPLTYQKTLEESEKIVINSFDKRIKAVKMLLEKDWQFFLFFIRESDILQHYFWNKEPIKKLYKKIDDFLGGLMEKDFDLIIISDHGFERVDKAINLNSWLTKEGYLYLKKEKKGVLDKKKLQKILERLKIDWIRRVVPRKCKKILKEEIGFEEAIVKNLIDWEKTKAIIKRSVKTMNVYLNTKNRSEKGIITQENYEDIRQEIISKLKDFFKRENINVKIWKKEEIYFGRAIENAPDIIIYLPKGYESNCFMFSSDIYVDLQEKIIGQHNQDAILITKDKLNLKENPNIIDFAPTILKYFSIPIPEYMDGAPFF